MQIHGLHPTILGHGQPSEGTKQGRRVCGGLVAGHLQTAVAARQLSSGSCAIDSRRLEGKAVTNYYQGSCRAIAGFCLRPRELLLCDTVKL